MNLKMNRKINNLEFLQEIKSKICKIIFEDHSGYYVMIPFIKYNESLEYIENYKNAVYIYLSDDLLKNDDLNDFLIQLDERYEFILNNEEISINYLDSSNYNFYVSINKYGYEELGEDNIKNFNSSFMEIISHLLKYNNTDATDILYKSVIDFYKNGQYDDATMLMNIIFNTNIASSINSSNCGCNNISSNCSSQNTTSLLNTGTNLINIDEASCLDKYKGAMYQWLQEMLSNYNFYCEWMYNEETPQDDVIDKLIALIKLLLLSEYDLSNLGSTSKCSNINNHSKGNTSKDNCDSIDDLNSSLQNGCSNASILNNYIKVLEWAKSGEIENNKNKIYIYGKQFAQIFPLLSF